MRRVCLIVALLLGLAAPAAGQATPAGGVAAAKEHFDKGQSLYLRGMYDEAALEFLTAYEAKAFPAFLFNAAVSYEKARLYERALDLFRRYLAESPRAPDRAAVAMRLTQLAPLVPPPGTRPPPGRPASQPASQPASAPVVAPKAPAAPTLAPLDTKGLVVVESKPAGALLYLDSKLTGPVGRTPWSGTLPPGDHQVIVEAKGFKPEIRTVRPGADRLLVLYFALSEEHYLGWIEIEANVPEAKVYVDRRDAGAIGRTPYSGFLKPGKHTIYLEREGYLPQSRELEIRRGRPHQLALTLDLVPHGWLSVNVNRPAAGARVLVDGQEVCQAPCRVEVSPGPHKVALDQRGFKRYRGTITVERATEVQLGATMTPAPSRVSAYVSFTFGAALLGTGLYFGLKSRSERTDLANQLDAGRPLLATDDPRIQSGWTHAIAADALFGLGGITVLLGVYYALRNPGPDSLVETARKSFVVQPVAGPGGVSVVGRF
jgi:tetratricopeptide (TPR) repeat protein